MCVHVCELGDEPSCARSGVENQAKANSLDIMAVIRHNISISKRVTSECNSRCSRVCYGRRTPTRVSVYPDFMQLAGAQAELFFWLTVEGYRVTAQQQLEAMQAWQTDGKKQPSATKGLLKAAALGVYEQYLSDKVGGITPVLHVKKTKLNLTHSLACADFNLVIFFSSRTGVSQGSGGRSIRANPRGEDTERRPHAGDIR